MSGPVDPLAPFGRVTGRASLTVLRQGGEESASFDELLERGRRGATRLAARGVGPGDSVAILGEPSVAFHVGVLSAWAAGAACLPLPPPAPLELPASWAERTGRVLATAGARVVVAPSGGAPADLPVPVVAAEDLDEGPGATPATPDDGDPGLILLTSGSSSEPKGVVISFRAVAARAESQLLEGLDDDRDRFLTWLPPAWSGGFNAQLLRPLASGVSSVVLPTGAVLEHPLRWLAEIGRWRATMSGCGTYGYGLVAGRLGHEPAPDVDLSCWTHVWSAGERIDPDTIGRFLALAAPLGLDPRSFQPRYSLSECSTVASRPAGAGLAVDAVDAGGLADGDARPSTGADAARFVSNGPPLRGVELWIEGPDGASLPERGVGEVRVRCPMMLDAYLGDPERTAQALAGGWLRTGDLGYVADGELYIAGRVKEVIIVHGRNHHAEDLERAAGAAAGLSAGACAAVAVPGLTGSEEVAIVAETALAGEALERVRREVVRRLWETAGVRAARVTLVPPGTLPRTGSGKLSRAAVRRSIAGGMLDG